MVSLPGGRREGAWAAVAYCDLLTATERLVWRETRWIPELSLVVMSLRSIRPRGADMYVSRTCNAMS